MTTVPVDTLLSLAERVEAATGPDRELDAAIALGAGWSCAVRMDAATEEWDRQEWTSPDGAVSASTPRPFTASLDAAMTLVPEGWDWLVRDDVEERGSFANVSRPSKQHIIDTWDEERGCFYASDTNGCNYARAATPALALTAAALKARAGAK